jgi:hypothetical protein
MRHFAADDDIAYGQEAALAEERPIDGRGRPETRDEPGKALAPAFPRRGHRRGNYDARVVEVNVDDVELNACNLPPRVRHRIGRCRPTRSDDAQERRHQQRPAGGQSSISERFQPKASEKQLSATFADASDWSFCVHHI